VADARDPFRSGALALDEAFTERRREIVNEADLLDGRDVVRFAPRRYGKSSLVWRVAHRLVRKRVLVARVDLMTTLTKERWPRSWPRPSTRTSPRRCSGTTA
jgi:hypothetical protein